MSVIIPQNYILFTLKEPIEHLFKHGFVYTVRKNRIKEGIKRICYKHKTNTIAIGRVKYVGIVRFLFRYVEVDGKLYDIDEYTRYSGFRTAIDWINACKRIYPKSFRYSMPLYKVELIKKIHDSVVER